MLDLELAGSRYRRSHNETSVKGFTLLVFALFAVSGFVRLWNTGTPPERIAEFEAISASREHLLAQFNARVTQELSLVESMGIDYGYKEAYTLRHDLYPMFDSLSRIDVVKSLEAITPFVNRAEQNLIAKLQTGTGDVGERNRAWHLYGMHPMEAEGKVTLSGLMKIPKGIFNHVVFCMLFIPFLLMGRLMVRTRFSFRAFAKAVGPYAWWGALCTVLWPFCATMHAEREPKETTRFFWLRFLYMMHARKLFLTIAEKEALIHEAGTADEAVDAVLERVHEAALAATGAQRRLAIVSFFAAFFTFSGFQVQPAFAETQQVVEQPDTAKAEPRFSYSGYGVMSLNGNSTAQEMQFNYLRFKPSYVNGRWSLTGEVDINVTTKAKTAYVGYDSPELKLRVEAGRIISPYAWNFNAPNKDEFNRTPLDDDLGVPFFDNGIVLSWDASVLHHAFNLKGAVTNGGGGYEDNNSSMDASLRVSTKTRFGSFGLTGQIGDQPDGFRELYAACYEVNQGPLSFRLLGLERPDIDGNGFMVSLVTRAGPWSFSSQYDQATVSGVTTRFCDFGINVMPSDNTRLKFRTLVSSENRPEFNLRVVQLF